MKSSGATELIQAIELALVGRSYVTPRITRDDGPDKFFCHVKQTKSPNRLTLRQREVLQSTRPAAILARSFWSRGVSAVSPSVLANTTVGFESPGLKMKGKVKV